MFFVFIFMSDLVYNYKSRIVLFLIYMTILIIHLQIQDCAVLDLHDHFKYTLKIKDCAVLDLHADGSLDMGIAWRLGGWHVR